MPVYKVDDLEKELVTPKHSTAFGPLITGSQIEVGLLFFKSGEGAKEHAHPHEQVVGADRWPRDLREPDARLRLVLHQRPHQPVTR